MAELGDRVRKARENYGMSVVTLAKRIGITRQQLHRIEKNETTDPGVLKVKAIAKILGVRVQDLLYGNGEESERVSTATALAGTERP